MAINDFFSFLYNPSQISGIPTLAGFNNQVIDDNQVPIYGENSPMLRPKDQQILNNP